MYAEISGRLDFGRYYIPEDTIFAGMHVAVERHMLVEATAGDIALPIESLRAKELTLVSNTGASQQWQCSGSGSILITSTVSDSDKLSFLQYIYIAPEYLYSFPPPPSPDYGLNESELRAGMSSMEKARWRCASSRVLSRYVWRCADPPY